MARFLGTSSTKIMVRTEADAMPNPIAIPTWAPESCVERRRSALCTEGGPVSAAGGAVDGAPVNGDEREPAATNTPHAAIRRRETPQQDLIRSSALSKGKGEPGTLRVS
jgi:hypothetical protein